MPLIVDTAQAADSSNTNNIVREIRRSVSFILPQEVPSLTAEQTKALGTPHAVAVCIPLYHQSPVRYHCCSVAAKLCDQHSMALEALRSGLRLRTDVTTVFLKAILATKTSIDLRVIDVWVLFLLREMPQFGKQVCQRRHSQPVPSPHAVCTISPSPGRERLPQEDQGRHPDRSTPSPRPTPPWPASRTAISHPDEAV